MLKTYKILSLLLSYPDAGLQAFLPEAISVLEDESLLAAEKIKDIGCFSNHYRTMKLTDWQADYVQLFDCSRSASLHLFEHLKGDSRDRGQAMVDLLEFYRENGMELTARELPDYLPVFLEFLSVREKEKAAELLAEPAKVVQRIYRTLMEKNHPYRHLLSAVVSLSACPPGQESTSPWKQDDKPASPDDEHPADPCGPYASQGWNKRNI